MRHLSQEPRHVVCRRSPDCCSSLIWHCITHLRMTCAISLCRDEGGRWVEISQTTILPHCQLGTLLLGKQRCHAMAREGFLEWAISWLFYLFHLSSSLTLNLSLSLTPNHSQSFSISLFHSPSPSFFSSLSLSPISLCLTLSLYIPLTPSSCSLNLSFLLSLIGSRSDIVTSFFPLIFSFVVRLFGIPKIPQIFKNTPFSTSASFSFSASLVL